MNFLHFHTATDQIRQIVEHLNKPPLNCQLSLVEFDDKPPLELLELLNKIFGMLEESHLEKDIQNETQDKTSERFCNFLKILGYPSLYDVSFQHHLVQGDKKTVQHIMHWILSRQNDLKTKVYLANFLVPLHVP